MQINESAVLLIWVKNTAVCANNFVFFLFCMKKRRTFASSIKTKDNIKKVKIKD